MTTQTTHREAGTLTHQVMQATPPKLGRHRGVQIGSHEFYVQTRLSVSNPQRIVSDVFHAGRVLRHFERDLKGATHSDMEAAITAMQIETETFVRERFAAIRPAALTTPPPDVTDGLLDALNRLVKQIAAGESPPDVELRTLMERFWSTHAKHGWLRTEASVAVLCVRAQLQPPTSFPEDLCSLQPGLLDTLQMILDSQDRDSRAAES